MVGRKPEDWRILTPIFSMLSPIIVGVLGWFISNGINDQKEINKNIIAKLDSYIDIQRKDKDEFNQKYAEVKYQCCSELRQGVIR